MAGRFATKPLARGRLLGGFQLWASDGEPISLTSRRARCLLAVVCLEGDTGVPRDRLCGLLWSDRAEDQARASLRQCLFELKAALGDLSGSLLDIGRERIVARPGAVDTDIAQVRRALAGIDAAELAAVGPLLSTGQVLEGLDAPGLFQDWLEQTRGAFEASLAADLGRCLSQLEDEARWGEVIALADAYLRRDPLHEGLAAAAIRAERASGRSAAAQKRLFAITRLLSKELGVAPSPALLQAANAEVPASAPPGSTAATEGSQHARPRIAVLPFSYPVGDPEQADFAEALAEDLIAGLTRSPLLAVMPRQSSFAYEPLAQAPGKICADLGVDYVVLGTVRRLGRALRVAAELVHGADETTVWSARYDRAIEDLFAVLDGITLAIVGTVEPALLEQEAFQAHVRPERSLEFWELFVSGRRHFWRSTTADVRKAEAFLDRALAIQPDDVSSLAILAHCRLYNVWVGTSTDPAAALEAAYRLALKAVSVSEWDAFAHYTLGVVLSVRDQWPEAEAEQRRALELNPFLAAALGELGRLLAFAGRADEAVAYSDRAIAASPNDPHVWLWYRSKAIARLLSGDLEGALRDALDACARGPHRFYLHILLAACYSAAGRMDEAGRAYAQAQMLARVEDAANRPAAQPGRDRDNGGLKALKTGHPFRDPADLARFLAALQAARAAATHFEGAD
jgi:TolB-like protein